jgi:hypothetical protein
MGKPIFQAAEYNYKKAKTASMDVVSVTSRTDGSGSLASLRSTRVPRPTHWSNASDHTSVPQSRIEPWQDTNVLGTEHPIRRFLGSSDRNHEVSALTGSPDTTASRTAITQNRPHISHTLEDIIIRNLRPRSFSLILGNQQDDRFGAVSELGGSNMESAMQRLRNHLRAAAELNLGDDLVHRTRQEEMMEPRDRLDAARTTRRSRSERRQLQDRDMRRVQQQDGGRPRTSTLQGPEIFQRWANARRPSQNTTPNTTVQSLVRRINNDRNLAQVALSTNSAQALAAREIYTQTADRLERTRDLLAARQAQHLMLSERLQESTRAIGAHIENIREALDLSNPNRIVARTDTTPTIAIAVETEEEEFS